MSYQALSKRQVWFWVGPNPSAIAEALFLACCRWQRLRTPTIPRAAQASAEGSSVWLSADKLLRVDL